MANLTSPKVEDGIAKCITKTDIAKMAAKHHVDEAVLYNGVLKDAVDIVQAVADASACLNPLGQIFVRIGLLASDKADKGLEWTKFTPDEIKQKFLTAMSEITVSFFCICTSEAMSSSKMTCEFNKMLALHYRSKNIKLASLCIYVCLVPLS